MAWKKLNTEPVLPPRFHKWNGEPGESAEGVLQAVRQGRWGNFAVLTQPDGSDLNVPLKGYSGGEGRTVAELVEELPVGTVIKLLYAGPVPGKRGRPRNHFDLYVRDAE